MKENVWQNPIPWFRYREFWMESIIPESGAVFFCFLSNTSTFQSQASMWSRLPFYSLCSLYCTATLVSANRHSGQCKRMIIYRSPANTEPTCGRGYKVSCRWAGQKLIITWAVRTLYRGEASCPDAPAVHRHLLPARRRVITATFPPHDRNVELELMEVLPRLWTPHMPRWLAEWRVCCQQVYEVLFFLQTLSPLKLVTCLLWKRGDRMKH